MTTQSGTEDGAGAGSGTSEDRSSGQDEGPYWARLFWIWLGLRTAFWVALSRLTQPNAPLDLAEMLAWGHQWQAGYPKHPPLPAWIAEASFRLSGGDLWGPYLAGYLLTAFCLWSAWRLARAVLAPRLAFAAALCLEGLVYFNYWFPAELNHNVACNACWAGVVLCLFEALRTDRLRWWLALGLAAALGVLAKYTIGLLFLSLAVYLVASPRGRRALARPGAYLAALVGTCALAPHVLWVLRHDLGPIHYAVSRAGASTPWSEHLIRPGYFCFSQVLRLSPVAFLLVPFASWQWRFRPPVANAPGSPQRWARDYLLVAVGGPVLLLLLLGLGLGCSLRDAWGSPLWTFFGVLVLLSVRCHDSPRAQLGPRWHFAIVAVGFVCFALGKNCLEDALTGRPKRTRFPGRMLAREVSRCWQARYGEPLPVVSGDVWLALNVSCYAPRRPTYYLFSPGNDTFTPWARLADLRQRGGALVWDADLLGDQLPPPYAACAPVVLTQPPLLLPYGGVTRLPPVRIGLAFVPPARTVP
jgi:hypothetical protein